MKKTIAPQTATHIAAHKIAAERLRFSLILVLLHALALSACQTDPSAWYPKGRASIASSRTRAIPGSPAAR